MFNEKVKLMNQLNSRDLTLSAAEARNLQSDIFDLLNHCAALSKAQTKAQSAPEEVITISMDGGKF